MKSLVVVSLLLGVSGCSSLPLQVGAEFVRVTHTEPTQKECKFLGDITGNQEGLFLSLIHI